MQPSQAVCVGPGGESKRVASSSVSAPGVAPAMAPSSASPAAAQPAVVPAPAAQTPAGGGRLLAMAVLSQRVVLSLTVLLAMQGLQAALQQGALWRSNPQQMPRQPVMQRLQPQQIR